MFTNPFPKDQQEEGRPQKYKQTKKILKNSAPQVRKRVLEMCDSDGEPSDVDVDGDDSDEVDEYEYGDVDVEAAEAML